MQKLEMAILKSVQFLIALFFTFVVLFYIGALALIPLSLLLGLVNFLSHGIGFNGIFATIVSVPAIAWLVMRLHKIPGVTDLLLDTGWSLIRAGAENFQKFDAIGRKLKGSSGGASASAAK